MKITWIPYAAAESMPHIISTSGGWFDNGHRWADYIETWSNPATPYLEALRADIIAKGIRYTGEQHQYTDDGVPLFDDGHVATFSYRGWGDLMAAIWSTEEDKDYSYMDFYC